MPNFEGATELVRDRLTRPFEEFGLGVQTQMTWAFFPLRREVANVNHSVWMVVLTEPDVSGLADFLRFCGALGLRASPKTELDGFFAEV